MVRGCCILNLNPETVEDKKPIKRKIKIKRRKIISFKNHRGERGPRIKPVLFRPHDAKATKIIDSLPLSVVSGEKFAIGVH